MVLGWSSFGLLKESVNDSKTPKPRSKLCVS